MKTGLEGLRRRYDTGIFERKELSNRIPVWIQQSPILTDDEGVLIAFLPGVGSKVDPLDARGTAHFLEHVPFSGTTRYPSRSLLENPIIERGGRINGSTGIHKTKYHISLPREEFELAAERLGELVLSPLFREDSIEKERGTISQEYRRTYSNGNALAIKIVSQFLFGDHPFGRLPIGELDHIIHMRPETLKDFHKKWYRAERIEIICGGAFSELGQARILETLEKNFGAIPSEERSPLSIDFPIENSPRHGVVHEPACRRDSVSITYPIPIGLESEEDGLHFLASTLADDLDSPLMIELREKRGWVYESGLCRAETRYDLWGFSVNLPVSAEHTSKAIEIFRKVLKNLSSDRCFQYKKRFQSKRKLAFRNPIDACFDAVEAISDVGHTISYEDYERRFDELTLADVFKWRDMLLETTPFICEIRTK